ncbi:uncharacterized protein RBU33_024798 isoform 2-T2 [Hipposideros larvatus]
MTALSGGTEGSALHYDRNQSRSPFSMSVTITSCSSTGRLESNTCQVVKVSFLQGQGVAIAAYFSYHLFAECSFFSGFNMAVLYTPNLIAVFFNFYPRTYLRSKREKLT